MRAVLLILAVMFEVAAAVLAVTGLTIVYDNSIGAQVVGGDAYNFIIYAARGTAWVCGGIVAALMGLACLLLPSALRLQT